MTLIALLRLPYDAHEGYLGLLSVVAEMFDFLHDSYGRDKKLEIKKESERDRERERGRH